MTDVTLIAIILDLLLYVLKKTERGVNLPCQRRNEEKYDLPV